MLNYLKKFALDILPSVAATIIGAYIVNHYITSKPDTPSAAVSPTESRKAVPKADGRAAAKPVENAGIPEPGIKAKGISERTMIETRAAENPAEVKPVEKPAETADTRPVDTKPVDAKSVDAKPVDAKSVDAKSADAKPVETASTPVEPRRHTSPGRDANDLARAAIERLRGSGEGAPRVQEAPKTVIAAPAAVAPVAPPSPQAGSMIRPLPPPIAVTAPSVDNAPAPAAPATPAYTASVDPNRPTPPAEIPPPPPRPPIDLRAGAADAVSHTKNVAEDVLAATKSMFHALLPGSDRNNNNNGAQQFTD